IAGSAPEAIFPRGGQANLRSPPCNFPEVPPRFSGLSCVFWPNTDLEMVNTLAIARFWALSEPVFEQDICPAQEQCDQFQPGQSDGGHEDYIQRACRAGRPETGHA